jgi:hypothetical protein
MIILFIAKNSKITKAINIILFVSPNIEEVFSEASVKALVIDSDITLYNIIIN